MRISDWSSDVCSSDLLDHDGGEEGERDRGDGAGDERSNGRRRQRRSAAPLAGHSVAVDRGDDAGALTRCVQQDRGGRAAIHAARTRSEEHTSELQSLMRISYAVFFLKKKKQRNDNRYIL